MFFAQPTAARPATLRPMTSTCNIENRFFFFFSYYIFGTFAIVLSCKAESMLSCTLKHILERYLTAPVVSARVPVAKPGWPNK
jgi:hypothetical protein